jgi:hypothetical protein
MFKTAKYSVARSTDRLELLLTAVLAAASLGLVAFWLFNIGKLTQEFIRFAVITPPDGKPSPLIVCNGPYYRVAELNAAVGDVVCPHIAELGD